jgi:hypothetical protein
VTPEEACEAITELVSRGSMLDADVPLFAFLLGDLELVDYLLAAREQP